MKGNVAEAVHRADMAVAASDFTTAKATLEEAIADVPQRPDREALIAPARERLERIAAKAAEQDTAKRTAASAERAEQHKRDAVTAVADLKAKIASGDYPAAIDAAGEAVRKFADTPSAGELSDLLTTATAKLKEQRDAVAAAEAEKRRQDAANAAAQKEREAQAESTQREREAGEVKARHERFVKYRDEGDAAFNKGDFAAARLAYEKALGEVKDDRVAQLLDQCIEKTTPQRIAVADFSITGDVGIADAGKAVAELLLPKFGGSRYQLVERSHLAKILSEHDLKMADIVENPALLRGKKLQGVRYLVLGSVVRLGNLAISARLVDVTTGDITQTAEVNAEDAKGLQSALGELAKVLLMTPEEKRAYVPKGSPEREKPPAAPKPEKKPEPNPPENPPPSTPALTLDLGSGVMMESVLIQPGTCTMGSNDGDSDEKPPHSVTISKPFYMGKYEVTQAQWEAVMGNNPSSFKGDGNLPVERVSWDDCQEFCKKLSAKTRKAVRLPTEAEWEYACRAGSKGNFCFGDDESGLGAYAWYDGNSDSKTHPMGQKKANAWGLYDMHGNGWEWCADWYWYYASGAQTDPRGVSSGVHRVLRGGSWAGRPTYCRAAYRRHDTPDYRNHAIGCRVVVSGGVAGTP